MLRIASIFDAISGHYQAKPTNRKASCEQYSDDEYKKEAERLKIVIYQLNMQFQLALDHLPIAYPFGLNMLLSYFSILHSMNEPPKRPIICFQSSSETSKLSKAHFSESSDILLDISLL